MSLTAPDSPFWFVSAIGVATLAIVWRVVTFIVDGILKKHFFKRRVGYRSDDDTKSDHTLWVDRLIESMSKNAEINQEIGKNLALILERQEIILEAIRTTQAQYQENKPITERILKFIERIEQKLTHPHQPKIAQ